MDTPPIVHYHVERSVPSRDTSIAVDPGFIRGAAGAFQLAESVTIDWGAGAKSKAEQARRTMIERGKSMRCILLGIMSPGRTKHPTSDMPVGEFGKPPESMVRDIHRATEVFRDWLEVLEHNGVFMPSARVLIERQQVRGTFGVREDLIMLSHAYAWAATEMGIHPDHISYVNGSSKLSAATQIMLGSAPGHHIVHETGPTGRASRKVNSIALVDRWWSWSGQAPMRWPHGSQPHRDLADVVGLAAQAWNPRGTFKTPPSILAGLRAADGPGYEFIERPWYQ